MQTDNDPSTAEGDPVRYFLDDMEYQGKTRRTRGSYRRVLRQFESHLRRNDGDSTGDVRALEEATYRDCMSWIHSLRDGKAESTVATYASYLHRFYAYMVQVGVFDANPMTVVMDELDESIDTDPTRREITVEAMRSFVRSIAHPLDRAIVVTLLKTGIRAGELCNLDRRDLDLEPWDGRLETNAEPRPRLDSRPDSLFISPEPSRGAVVNGEERTASNKRKRGTVVPVDDELESVLADWLAIRPDPVSPAEPLFVSTTDRWGHRLTPDMVHHIVETHASRRGWHRPGGDAEENVTPHYFRHFFTTHLRDRTGDRGVVKYLRGDVADDVVDTYTHNWGDRVRETYERHIYRLL